MVASAKKLCVQKFWDLWLGAMRVKPKSIVFPAAVLNLNLGVTQLSLSLSPPPLSLSLRVAFIEIAMRAYAARVGVGVEKRESGTKKRSGSEAPFQSSLRSKYDHSRINCSILINVERNVVSLMVNAVGL